MELNKSGSQFVTRSSHSHVTSAGLSNVYLCSWYLRLRGLPWVNKQSIYVHRRDAFLADRRFHTEGWIHNSTAAGPRAASAGSSKPGCQDGTPHLGAWPALTLPIFPPWPWETTLSHPFPDPQAPGPPATRPPREDQRGETCTAPRPVCCPLRFHHGSAERQLRPDTPGARDSVGYPGPAERTREAGQLAEAHQQVPHPLRSRDSTHPGAEAPPRGEGKV